MKSKLINELLNVLANVKETQADVTLDLSEDNKESVYNELLIPLMNLTNADDIDQLHKQLEFLINGDVDSSDYDELATTLVNYILDDESAEAKFSDELNSLIINCVAALNAFNDMKDQTEPQEFNLDRINSEVLELLKAEDATETPTDEVKPEEGVSDALTDSKNEAAAVEGEEEPAVEPEAPEGEGGAEPTLELVDPASEVDDTPWAEINKVELKNTLVAALEESEGNMMIVNEVFALVKSEKPSDWQWPHHVVKDGKVLLNVGGLQTAALFLLKPNSSKNLTSDERTAIATHLLGHYDQIKMEKPDKLNKLVEGKESTIVINIKDDELQEFGEMFKVQAEEIGTYVGLIEALLTDFVNSGIIDIESEATDMDESVVAVKLNKRQTEEFIKYFDIISDDIVSILGGDFDALSYKQTDTSLERRFNESLNKVDELTSQVTEMTATVEAQKTQIKTLAGAENQVKLDQVKFQAIIDFVKSSENVDETVLQFVHNVIEAESPRDVTYMAKIGKSFMKASNNSDLTKFVKKSGIISRFNASEVADLLNIVDDDKKESALPAVSKTVDRLAEMLD
jgi:hypothetical protein